MIRSGNFIQDNYNHLFLIDTQFHTSVHVYIASRVVLSKAGRLAFTLVYHSGYGVIQCFSKLAS